MHSSSAPPFNDNRISGFFVSAIMKKRICAHFARNQPFYEAGVLACIWILLLVGAFSMELHLQ